MNKQVENAGRCVQCILPKGYPGVTFNDDGQCSLCEQYTPKKVLGEDALWKTLGARKGRKYDVLVPASGGRDSSFVMYHAAKRFGKRVLAIHFDNGFQVEQAGKNFVQAAESLGIDYKIVKSHYGLPEKIVHHAVKAALPFCIFDMTTNVCVACTYGYRAAAYREAVARGIPAILWGDSDAEAMSFEYRSNRGKFFFSRKGFHYVVFMMYTLLFQLEFWIPGKKFFSFGAPSYGKDDVLEVHFFDYIAWDRRQIKETITEQLGWGVPEGTVSSWRFDCTIHHLVNYCFKQTYGFSKDFDGFANMIRDGKMEKEEALEHEQHLGYVDEELKRILREDLRLNRAELSEYFGITA